MAVNAVDKSEPGHNQIAGQHESAKARKAQGIEVEETNKQKELQFKASHALFICFLLWILCVDLTTPCHAHN